MVYRWPNLSIGKQIQLPDTVFAEGITVFNNRVFQLTWKTGEVIVYHGNDFAIERNYFYAGEGWGLTVVDHRLVRSDGSHCLFFHHPSNFRFTRKRCLNNQQYRLNALATQGGVIYANDYPSDRILRIDQETFEVLDMLDVSALRSGFYAGVTNGIAAMSTGEILVTGKNWNKMYQLDVSGCRSPTSFGVVKHER